MSIGFLLKMLAVVDNVLIQTAIMIRFCQLNIVYVECICSVSEWRCPTLVSVSTYNILIIRMSQPAEDKYFFCKEDRNADRKGEATPVI